MTSDRVFDILLTKSLDKIDEAAELAYALYRTLEGDDVDASELLRKYGYVDEDGEWLYGEDE
jgi:hypothetical protein